MAKGRLRHSTIPLVPTSTYENFPIEGRGTVGGMVSLATRQTPQIDDNTPARGGITIYNGVWRVDKLTIPPTVPPAIPPTIPRSSSRPSKTCLACKRPCALLRDRASLAEGLALRRASERASEKNYGKQSKLINQSTDQSTYGQRPVEFDALVPFIKVWRSNSAS